MTNTRGMSAALVCVLAVAVLSAQPPAPVLHDLKAMPELEVNANIKIKKVMGEIGTFMLGRFRAGFKSAPHHHTYEQINIGLTGMYTLPVAGTRHPVSAMRGVVIPPDVEHNNDVPGDAGDPELIEFQSTRRLDFPPERQQVTLPVGPTALPVTQGRQVGFDFGTRPRAGRPSSRVFACRRAPAARPRSRRGSFCQRRKTPSTFDSCCLALSGSYMWLKAPLRQPSTQGASS